jgi:hypothetical protein
MKLQIDGVDSPIDGFPDNFKDLPQDQQHQMLDAVRRDYSGKKVSAEIKDYGSKSWGDTAAEAAASAIQGYPKQIASQIGTIVPAAAPLLSAAGVGTSPHPVQDTAIAIKNAGLGLLQKFMPELGDDAVRYADEVGQHFKNRYGSGWAGLKQAIASDPYSVASELSIFLGARSGAGRVAGITRTPAAGEGAIAGFRARGEVSRALNRDRMVPEEIVRRGQEMEAAGRPGTTIAEVGGENVRGLVERAAQSPGEARTILIPQLEARQKAQQTRLADDLASLTGTKKSAMEATDQAMQQRATQSKPLYQKAMAFDAAADPDIAAAFQKATATGWGEEILKSPTLKRTLQSEYGVKDISQVPLMVQIDAWKKAADDVVGAALRAGEKNRARVVGDVRNGLIDVVKAKNPDYQAALNAYSGPTRYMDAVEDGGRILKPSMTAEQLRADFGKLGESEQEAYRVGAVSAIVAKMRGKTGSVVDAAQVLNSVETRAKVAAIMPTPEAAASWNKRLDFEVSLSQLSKRTLGGSPTARRMAEGADSMELGADLAMHALGGSVFGGILGGARRFIRGRMSQGTDAALAKQLQQPATKFGQ